MKKVLKKRESGFTFIELLAIIVLLAVTMIVTMTIIISSMSDAKEKQFKNTANIVANYLEKQYILYKTGGISESPNNDFVAWTGNDYKSLNRSSPSTSGTPIWEILIVNAGVAKGNLNSNNDSPSSYAYYNINNNRMCVVLIAKEGGSFYVEGGINEAKSSGCTY